MLQYHKELARALFSFPPPKNVVLKEDKIYFSLDGVVRRALCGLIFSTGAGPVLVARASVAVAEVQRVSFRLFAYYHLFQSICNTVESFTSMTVLHRLTLVEVLVRHLCAASLERHVRPISCWKSSLKTNDGCLQSHLC